LFGTAEHPLKDGDIFKYIDGGGMVYLDHGFTDLFHAEYGDGRGNRYQVSPSHLLD